MKSAISPLRELAGLVEKKAVALSKAEWETDKVPTGQPNRKKESESDDIGTKNGAGADELAPLSLVFLWYNRRPRNRSEKVRKRSYGRIFKCK
jgi:hypothetical protein